MNTIFKLTLVVATLVIITSNPASAQAPAPVSTPQKVMTVEQMIDSVAPTFNQDPKLISKISYCESHHKVKPNDGGRGVNITGIHDATFDRWLPLYKKETGETLNKKSTLDQIKMMSWAFSKGENYRDDWTTYRAYIRGGTYTFYSRLLKKTFTVYCK